VKFDAILPIILALIVALGLLAKCKTPTYEWTRTLYLVNRGETLWSICEQYCPKRMDLWEYYFLVKKENNMVSSTIHEGDTLTILKEVNKK